MRVLLSIKPEYAEKILSGTKRFEYRKAVPRNKSVRTVVIYATMPVGKVVGELEVGGVLCEKPKDLVQRCAKAQPGALCVSDIEDAEREPAPAPTADLLVQNLRLTRHPGDNVWPANRRRWSETALASLADGRLLVVFSRTPLTMRDFNARLLCLGLGVRAAMHLEGGPEASLSIHGGGVDVDLAGSYETGFSEDDTNEAQWPVPNVLGVGSRSP